MKRADEERMTQQLATDAEIDVVDAWASVERSWGFPAFARDFPRDAELTRLVRSFTAGDYHAVRVGADALAEVTPREDVRRAAGLLRARTDPDR